MASPLTIIADAMEALGIPYDFETYGGEVDGAYWVGHYTETAPTTEDGLQEADFILTGTTRGTWAELEAAKEAVRKRFDPVAGYTEVDGDGVAIYYTSATPVPTDAAGLKRIEITLNIKHWRI